VSTRFAGGSLVAAAFSGFHSKRDRHGMSTRKKRLGHPSQSRTLYQIVGNGEEKWKGRSRQPIYFMRLRSKLGSKSHFLCRKVRVARLLGLPGHRRGSRRRGTAALMTLPIGIAPVDRWLTERLRHGAMGAVEWLILPVLSSPRKVRRADKPPLASGGAGSSVVTERGDRRGCWADPFIARPMRGGALRGGRGCLFRATSDS